MRLSHKFLVMVQLAVALAGTAPSEAPKLPAGVSFPRVCVLYVV
jgi:hypothetical protein